MKINEIFYSLQGEGFYSGTPSVFVRMSGCNARCPFCDTQYEGGSEMAEDEVVAAVVEYAAKVVVITGGEPSLQLTETLVDALHREGRRVHVETNGTRPLPPNVDWVTLSPKDAFLGQEYRPVLQKADELKVVFDGEHAPEAYKYIATSHHFVQPCDTGDSQRNATLTAQAVEYCMRHPEWRLSLQLHKILNIR